MQRLSTIYKTNEHISGLVLRITLALVVLPHGCQLLLGWFGGFGFTGTMHYFTEVEGLPWMVGFSVILLQFFGSLFILFGFMGRLFSFSMIFLFIGMIVNNHWHHGFFMNWMGNQKGEGFEFHLLVIGIATALAFSGSGAFSVDAWLSRKKHVSQPLFDLANIYS